ncbi:MAG: Crp/Fnr family transcriptional regulator [Polyangiaceae bacterium]
MGSSELHKLLARTWIFSELTDKEVDGLATIAQVRVAKPKQTVVEKGAPAEHVFAVLRGRLKVLIPGVEHDTAFRILGPGDLIGEISAFDGQPRSAAVQAIELCQLAVIDLRDFHSFLRAHSQVNQKLLAALARRIRELSERVEDRASLSVRARLAKCLVGLADRYGRETPEGHVSELRLSQAELGNLVDATRECVNKVLRAWRAQRVVTHEPERIVVHDMVALRAIADRRN